MRKVLIAMLMASGVALIGPSTSSATPAAGGPIANAATDISTTEVVHCRRWWHRHRFHRRYSRVIVFGHRCGRWY